MRPSHFALACAALTFTTSAVHAQGSALDYPQWRGRNGDGSASAFTPPATWPDALTRRWHIEVGEGYATPLVIDGTVYVFARRHEDEVMIIVSASRQGVVQFKPARRDGRWIVETVWQTNDVSMYLSNPVVMGDALYGLSQRSSGEYFALDAQSGNVLWLGPPRQATNTAVVKAADVLFLLNDDGELIVAKGNRTTFEPLKRYTVADSATWAQPAISGKRIFIKDASALTLWTFD